MPDSWARVGSLPGEFFIEERTGHAHQGSPEHLQFIDALDLNHRPVEGRPGPQALRLEEWIANDARLDVIASLLDRFKPGLRICLVLAAESLDILGGRHPAGTLIVPGLPAGSSRLLLLSLDGEESFGDPQSELNLEAVARPDCILQLRP